jgi:hypothetical protein
MHGQRISKEDVLFLVVELAPTLTTLQADIGKACTFHIDSERLREREGR